MLRCRVPIAPAKLYASCSHAKGFRNINCIRSIKFINRKYCIASKIISAATA